VFPSVKRLLGKTSKSGIGLKDDEAFVTALLEETGVALVHGTAFGSPGQMRLSYAASNAELEDAVSRIQDFCAGIA
jgi:aspartate aminotransferase